MRTYKQNVILLDSGERVTIKSGDAEVTVTALADEGYQTLEIKLPPGSHMSNLGDLPSGREVDFRLDGEGMQEIVGPLSFITFRGYQVDAAPFTEQQIEYLAAKGFRFKEDDDLNATPETSSLTHPDNA